MYKVLYVRTLYDTMLGFTPVGPFSQWPLWKGSTGGQFCPNITWTFNETSQLNPGVDRDMKKQHKLLGRIASKAIRWTPGQGAEEEGGVGEWSGTVMSLLQDEGEPEKKLQRSVPGQEREERETVSETKARVSQGSPNLVFYSWSLFHLVRNISLP